MNIQGMNFQTDNATGGRLSKIERAMYNLTADSVGKESNVRYMYLHDAVKLSQVSKASLYRYWQYMYDNDIRYHFNGMVIRADVNLCVRVFIAERVQS